MTLDYQEFLNRKRLAVLPVGFEIPKDAINSTLFAFVGCELKPSYWETAAHNLADAEHIAHRPSLFDLLEEGVTA